MHPDSGRIAENQQQEADPDSQIPSPDLTNKITTRFKRGFARIPWSLEVILFGLAISVYLLTHLVGLTRFPIYFFSDEAIQTVAAANLVRDNLRDEEGTYLPTYFKNGPYYNLSTSVYAQVLPYILFGKSVLTTSYLFMPCSCTPTCSIAAVHLTISTTQSCWGHWRSTHTVLGRW
jgi:hypothetical protein